MTTFVIVLLTTLFALISSCPLLVTDDMKGAILMEE